MERKTIPLERQKTIEYLKEKITMRKNHCPGMNIILFHCLHELNDHSLTEETQRYLISGNVQEIKSQEQGLALVYILMTSNEKFDEFELCKYGRSDQLLCWLNPVIKLSTKAR